MCDFSLLTLYNVLEVFLQFYIGGASDYALSKNTSLLNDLQVRFTEIPLN